MNFHDTQMGRNFFEHQLPQLIEAIQALTAALDRPTQTITLPVSAEADFLHDLFLGDYEPEIFKASPKIQRFSQTADQDYKALVATLSEDSVKQLEEYEMAISERTIAVAEQAYESGFRTAVQMIVAGLARPGQANKAA